MTLVDRNGMPINGQRYPGPIKRVQEMLGKPMNIISKIELCGLICSQRLAIETLVTALEEENPENSLIKGLRKPLSNE